MANYIVPVLLLALLVYCLFKKINAYDHFVGGAKQAIDLCISTFPYLVAIFFAVELFKISGMSSAVSKMLSPIFSGIGVPS